MSEVQASTRRFLKIAAGAAAGSALASAGLGAFASRARAQRKAPVAGVEYRPISPSVAVESGNKIEVLEFFWYACPHCAALEPAIKEWAKQLPADVAFRKVHVPFNELKHQQLFYTLEAMGKGEAVIDKVFSAIHVDRDRMDSLDKITAQITKAGLDKKAFNDAWESFGVQTKMRKATSLAATYRIESVPTIIVNGKYMTMPSIAGGNQGVLQVADLLIEQERTAAKK